MHAPDVCHIAGNVAFIWKPASHEQHLAIIDNVTAQRVVGVFGVVIPLPNFQSTGTADIAVVY